MLLQNATSYVTIMNNYDILYESIMRDFSGYDIANKYIGTTNVNEPELISLLSVISISSTSGLTKNFFVP